MKTNIQTNLLQIDFLGKILLVMAFCHLLPLFLHAQELRFQSYNIEDGLSAVGTYHPDAIIQDQEGFMWFTTFNGVNRFDGQTFKVFRDDPSVAGSIGDEMTGSLFVASDGKVWVGTADNGIYILDPETEVFEQIIHDPQNPNSICGRAPYFIKEDQGGNIWVGHRMKGVCRWSPKSERWDSFEELLSDGHSYYETRNGMIWVGTARGLYRKLPNSEEFTKVPGLTSFIVDMEELESGNLLTLIRPKELLEVNIENLSVKKFEPGFPSDKSGGPNYITKSKDGIIWMGTTSEIWRYLPEKKTYLLSAHDPNDKNSALPGSNMFSYEDKDGSMWYMSISQGISVTHNSNNPFEIYDDGYVQEFFLLDEDRILLNQGSGLTVFNKKKKQIESFPLPGDLANYHIHFMEKIGDKIYIGFHGLEKIQIIDVVTGAINEIPGSGWGTTVDRENRIWSSLKYWDESSQEWIIKFDEMANALPDFIPSMGHLVETYFDDQNRIWLTSGAGLFRYDFEKKVGRRFKEGDPGAPSGHMGFNFFKGSKGRFYLNTTMGLSIYQPDTDSFLNLGHADGLLHNSSGAIVEDQYGDVWIGNPLGLQKLELETNTFTNYNVEDGLFHNNIYHHRPYCDEDGYLYFGTGGKLIRFHPDSLQRFEATTPVYLMDFFLSNELITPRDSHAFLQKQLRFSESINLTYNQNDFGFSYVMPFYYKPKQIDYFYMLEPYEEDWILASNKREIQYTNIDPGHYTFRVKARTAAGVWSTNVASIEVHISPPWWKTWWAYLSYVLLMGASVFGFYRFQLHRQLEKAETKKIKEIDELKSRLYTNITHEFRTPLTVIMGMTDNIIDHKKEKQLIKRNSKSLLRLINQLLDLSKIDSGKQKLNNLQADIIPYLRYLSESFYSMASEKNIRLTFYSEEESLLMDFDEVKLQHVIYNLLSNAIKFTDKNGTITFQVRQEMLSNNPVLKFKVSDDGVGIDAEKLEKIFDRFYQIDGSSTRKGEGSGVGLALTKELVELMGGNIEVESLPGQGSDFIIVLPITNMAPLSDVAAAQKTAVLIDPKTVGKELEKESEVQVLSDSKPILLLVEDNQDVAIYIEEILKKDYQVIKEVNGNLGIEKAKEIIPDIIISDVMMPEKDGFELTLELKKDERTSHIPIILLTAKAADEDRIAGLETGADAYLMKPFNKRELIIRLEKLLSLRKALQLHYSKNELLLADPTAEQPTILNIENQFIQKLREAVMDHLDDSTFDVVKLSQSVQLSNSQLYRKLKGLMDETPNRFIQKVRLNQAMHLLKNSDLNISEIAYAVGFTDPNYFSRAFSKEFTKPPGFFRK